MEPLNDDELKELLQEWHAPPTPAMGVPRKSRWRWLWSGTIRVPVPIGILAMVVLLWSVYWGMTVHGRVEKPSRTVTLADFQPVKQLEPRIIRSGYEGK